MQIVQTFSEPDDDLNTNIHLILKKMWKRMHVSFESYKDKYALSTNQRNKTIVSKIALKMKEFNKGNIFISFQNFFGKK